MTAEETVRQMRERYGLLWQGLDATEAIEAYRKRFGKLPAEVWAHKGDEVTGVGVVLTYARDIPAGHLWLPYGPTGDLRSKQRSVEAAEDSEELAWGLVANSPDWDVADDGTPCGEQAKQWREAAIRWRDAWHIRLAAIAPALEEGEDDG